MQRPLKVGYIHHKCLTRYCSSGRPEKGLRSNNLVSHSKDLLGPLSQLVGNYYANLAHYLAFSVFYITKMYVSLMCSACCVGYIQIGKRQTNASKQANVSNFMFCFVFCFFFLSLWLSLSSTLFVGSFVVTHRDTLSD